MQRLNRWAKGMVGVVIGVVFLGSARGVRAAYSWEAEGCAVTQNGVTVVTMQGILCLFERMFAFVIPLVGMAALVAIFMGAYKLMTSGGNSQQLKKGWGLVTYAVLGIVAVIAGYILIKLLETFTGVDITTVSL